MANKTPEMSTAFAAWYGQTFMDEGTVRAARWKGVVETAAGANYRTVEVLLRLAFGIGEAAGTKNEDLSEKYQAVLGAIGGDGKTFDPIAARRELQVLAAAVLVQLFATLADAPLGVLTTSFGGARKPDLPMDLVGLARNALLSLTRAKHARPDAKDLELTVPKVEFELSQAATQSMDPVTWKAELDRLRDATRAATRAIVEGQNRIVRRLSLQTELGHEELQMLWWLIGEHSDVGKPFAKLDSAARPLLLANELARMTKASPGPASIAAMLTRAGVADKAMPVRDAVNAVELEWAKNVTTSTNISAVSTPLHFALEKRAEIGTNDGWQPSWTALTGLPAEASMSAIRLAELFYREHLYIHVAG
jgi:hypothetical protein